MKKILYTILFASVFLGGWILRMPKDPLAVNIPRASFGAESALEFNLKLTEAYEHDGRLRHDVNYISPRDGGKHGFMYWDPNELVKLSSWCEDYDEMKGCIEKFIDSDDLDFRDIRHILYAELQTKTPIEITEELKEGGAYSAFRAESPLISLEGFSSFFNTAEASSTKFSQFIGSLIIAANDQGAAATLTIDSAFVKGTSGDAYAVLTPARMTVVNGRVGFWYYCTAAAGVPNEALAYIYGEATGADDIDRPNTGAALYTSANIDFSACGTAQYVFADFTPASVTAGTLYWVILTNNEADPVTNNFTVQVRNPLDRPSSGFVTGLNPFATYSVTNGFSADVTATAGAYASGVFVTGPISFGNPYVATGAAHASNQNYRGNRLTPTEDTVFTGIYGVIDSNYSSTTIAQGSTVLLDQKTGLQTATRIGGQTFAPITTTGGLAYDFLQKAGANDTFATIYTMGNSPPADVQNAGSPMCYADGATLGSLTVNCQQVYEMVLEIGDNPEIPASGGGGTTGGSGIIIGSKGLIVP